MKRLVTVVLLASLAVPATAIAGEPGAHRVVAQWACDRQVRPTQREIADWFGMANFDQAYDVRARTHRALYRACQRGAAQLDIVLEERRNGTFVVSLAAR